MDQEKVHVFEKAGLGKAPFFFDGWFEGNATYIPETPMAKVTACDYCSTLIKNCFRIKSSDGKSFIVGSDCVKKTGDAGLIKIVNEEVKKQKYQRESARIKEAEKIVEMLKPYLLEQPHPYYSSKTGYDYVVYCFNWGGHAGRLKAARIVETVAKLSKFNAGAKD